MRGREGGEGGGGRRRGWRREKRGREEGEEGGGRRERGGKKGREGKIARAKRAPLQKGGGRRWGGRGGGKGAGVGRGLPPWRGREGEVRGREGGEAYPPVNPLRTVIPIPNFLSHFVSTDMPEANRKSNI